MMKKKKKCKETSLPNIHFSGDKLKKLLKSTNIRDQELNRETGTVKRICNICLKYKKTKLTPALGFSLSKDFMMS